MRGANGGISTMGALRGGAGSVRAVAAGGVGTGYSMM